MKFHLFAWDDYDSAGPDCTYYGAFDSVELAMNYNHNQDSAEVIEVRNGGLFIVAESGFKHKWDRVDRPLGWKREME